MDNFGCTSTPSSLSGFSPATEAVTDACDKCFAPWGHKHYCPTINRNVAEACSTGYSLADALRLLALGVIG